MNEFFRKFAHRVAAAVGSYWAFLIALSSIIIWAVTGPFFHFSEAWQLVINTGTTIVTFLMIFLVQNSQNRDAKAVHLKLDELIQAQKRAHNRLMGSEEYSDKDLKKLEEFVMKEKSRRTSHKKKNKNSL